MQHFANSVDRIERLKKALSIKSDDLLAARLGISKRTLNYAKLENKVGIKTLFAIQAAERGVGIMPPEDASLSHEEAMNQVLELPPEVADKLKQLGKLYEEMKPFIRIINEVMNPRLDSFRKKMLEEVARMIEEAEKKRKEHE
jgi:hypothetical protein